MRLLHNNGFRYRKITCSSHCNTNIYYFVKLVNKNKSSLIFINKYYLVVFYLSAHYAYNKHLRNEGNTIMKALVE